MSQLTNERTPATTGGTTPCSWKRLRIIQNLSRKRCSPLTPLHQALSRPGAAPNRGLNSKYGITVANATTSGKSSATPSRVVTERATQMPTPKATPRATMPTMQPPPSPHPSQPLLPSPQAARRTQSKSSHRQEMLPTTQPVNRAHDAHFHNPRKSSATGYLHHERDKGSSWRQGQSLGRRGLTEVREAEGVRQLETGVRWAAEKDLEAEVNITDPTEVRSEEIRQPGMVYIEVDRHYQRQPRLTERGRYRTGSY